MRGRFITFEGGEGAGKSTQIARLAQAVADQGLSVVMTREPGGSPGAEQIRTLLVEGAADRWSATTEALLHFAARRDHLDRTVLPALDSGTWVLCDRFADSTMAYQGYGHKLGRNFVEELQVLVLKDFMPDLTVILDIAPEEGLARAAERRGNEDRYESMELAFHRRIREGFQDIARREPDRCFLVDAAQDTDAVAQQVLQGVSARLGRVFV